MGTEIKKKLRPDSLIKKCICGILAMACVMLILITILMNDFMFRLLKPTLQNNYAALTSAVSTKVSYILHGNSQYVLKFWRDEEMLEDALKAVRQEGVEAEKSRSKVLEKISEERIGETETGAIVSSRNLFLIVDGNYILARTELEPYAEQTAASEWFGNLRSSFGRICRGWSGTVLFSCFSGDRGDRRIYCICSAETERRTYGLLYYD